MGMCVTLLRPLSTPERITEGQVLRTFSESSGTLGVHPGPVHTGPGQGRTGSETKGPRILDPRGTEDQEKRRFTQKNFTFMNYDLYSIIC